MSITELKNSIVQKVLETSDIQLLNNLNSLLTSNDSSSFYSLYDWEMKVIEEGISDREKGEEISAEDVLGNRQNPEKLKVFLSNVK